MPVFRPFLLKQHITDISLSQLQELGIRVLLLDVDNTLTAHNSQQLSPEIAAWLDAVQAAGITPLIVSNGKYERVRPFAENLGLPFTASAAKPLPFGFLRAVKQAGVTKTGCLAVGDQIFTDILGANMAGIRSVQVLPLDLGSDNGFIRFKRKLERILMKNWQIDNA